MTLTFGSLFSGIGGIDLGFEWAGLKALWQVEVDNYATEVLKRRFADITRFRDIREWPSYKLCKADIIAGGFPCQDISTSGRRDGLIGGAKSSLWGEFANIISHLRPGYVLIENVPAMLFPVRKPGGRVIEPAPIERVLSDLAQIGFDAEWQLLPASAFGAPQKRERLFIVAYPGSVGSHTCKVFDRAAFETFRKANGSWQWDWRAGPNVGSRIRPVPDPRICRMVTGVPTGLHRFRGIGNAVVPQAAEVIAELIKLHAARTGYVIKQQGYQQAEGLLAAVTLIA
jgi:DNA (cytosine-5)-methyltransferase 1